MPEHTVQASTDGEREHRYITLCLSIFNIDVSNGIGLIDASSLPSGRSRDVCVGEPRHVNTLVVESDSEGFLMARFSDEHNTSSFLFAFYDLRQWPRKMSRPANAHTLLRWLRYGSDWTQICPPPKFEARGQCAGPGSTA